MREGGRPGDDRGAAVLHRVRDGHQRRAPLRPPPQLHPRLLPHRGQARGLLAPAHHAGFQKGDIFI